MGPQRSRLRRLAPAAAIVLIGLSAWAYSGRRASLAGNLVQAVAYRNVPEVRTLLRRGADPNTRTMGRVTVLMLAAGYGYADVAAALLAGGGDPRSVDAAGRTAADWAATNQNGEVLELLRSAPPARR